MVSFVHAFKEAPPVFGNRDSIAAAHLSQPSVRLPSDLPPTRHALNFAASPTHPAFKSLTLPQPPSAPLSARLQPMPPQNHADVRSFVHQDKKQPRCCEPRQNAVALEINTEINKMLARDYTAASGTNNFLELALSLLPPAAKLAPLAFLSIKSITNPFALASLQQAPQTAKLAHEAATTAINSLQQTPWLQIRLRDAQALLLDVSAKNVGERIKIIDSLLEQIMATSLRSGAASAKSASASAHREHIENIAALEKTNRVLQAIKASLESQQKAFAAKP